MKPEKQSLFPWPSAGVLAGGLLPLLFYWLLVGCVPSVSVGEAKRLLGRTNSTAVLVDIRPVESYSAHHAAGAVNWPAADMVSLASLKGMPPELQGKKLLLINEDGLGSAQAVRRLRTPPGLEAFNVSGGMTLWDTDLSDEHSPAGLRPMSIARQWLAAITGFGVKPVHMVLCVLVILWLWPQRAPDLLALRWGLLIFWLGEVACAVNYLFMGGFSEFWEYLHNYGNSIGFSFTIYAILDGVDRRIIKSSVARDRCAVLGLCRACIKYADVPCGLRRIFSFTIISTIVIATMLLCVPLQAVSYNTSVFGRVTNYSHSISDQLYELRYSPVLAIALLAASWLLLRYRQADPVTPAKILFAAATGPLTFGLVRLFVFSIYHDELVWENFWEEATELLYVFSAAVVLWIFRDSLFVKPGPATPESTGLATAQ